MQSLKDTWVNPKLFTSEEMNRVLGTDMEREYSLHALATRPGVTLKAVAGMTKTDGAPVLPLEDFSDDELFQAETEVKYSGYISRQKAEIERTLANETLKIPAELDYDSVPGLSFEVRQKLKSISPETIGQASRISGVTPAAVSLLLVHLKRRYYYVKDKGTQAKEKRQCLIFSHAWRKASRRLVLRPPSTRWTNSCALRACSRSGTRSTT